MNIGQARTRLVCGGAALAIVALIAGCGSTYRPVVTPIGPSGPPAQAQSYAIVVSAPSPTTPGIVTVVDFSGDSVLAIAPIGNGASGAVVVSSYADGLAALKAGKSVRYIGPGGPTNFDSYHTSAGIFVINAYDSSGNVKVLGQLTNNQLQAVTP